MNLRQLATIMKDLLGCENLNSLEEDCLLSGDSSRHSVYKLIAQLSN